MLFFAGLFISPVGIQETIEASGDTTSENILETQFESSSILTTPIRVAMYNTTNSTKPSYVQGTMYLNNSWVFSVLTNAGHAVTEVNQQDISNHELMTANYDVLVLVDLIPNENITELVKDFWDAGGGILAFDSGGVR